MKQIADANKIKTGHINADIVHIHKAIFVIAFELFVMPEIEIMKNLIKFTAAAKLLETVNEPDTNVDEVVKAAASLKMIEALNEPAEVDTNLENLIKFTAAAKLLETVNEPDTNVDELVKAAASLKMIEALNEPAEVDTNLENLLKLTSAAKLLETIKPEMENAEVTNLENLLKLTAAAKLLETIKPETENAEDTNLENVLKFTAAAKLLKTIKPETENDLHTSDGLVVMTTTSYVNGIKKVFEDETNNPLIEIIVPKDGEKSSSIPRYTHTEIIVPKDGEKSSSIPRYTHTEIIVPKDGEKSSSIPRYTHTENIVTKNSEKSSRDTHTENGVSKDGEKFPRKIFGIQGGTNQCYSNALFQMLYSIPEMRKTFTETKQNVNNMTTNLFINRFKQIHSNNTNINIIVQDDDTCLAKEYGNHMLQHDVNEIFKWFIQQFEYSNIDSIRNFSNIFKFNEYADFICKNGNKSLDEKPTKNEMIELPIKDNDNRVNNINDLLKFYSDYEVLDPSQNAHSDRCGDVNTNTANIKSKKIRIELPDTNKYIVIGLGRFKSEGGIVSYTQTKIRNKITPNKTITIDNNTYTLTGVICHRGNSMRPGHYVYYECDSNGNYIRLYNDSWIIEYNQIKNDNVEKSYNGETNTDGYMFLYSRNNYDAQN